MRNVIAAGLCFRYYWRFIPPPEIFKMGSDDDDAAMAASQVIEAVSTVLQSMKSVPELFPAMEGHFLPMLVSRRYVR